MSILEKLSSENTLFGVPIRHSFASLYVLDELFDRLNFYQVVELGTYKGGLSTFLWVECLIRGKRFLSVDVTDMRMIDVFAFLKGDVLKNPLIRKKISEYLSCTTTFLYCDNGNKPKEIRTYAPLLPSRSVLGVHDWGVEVTERDVSFLNVLNFYPLHDINKLCSELHTLQRFWIRG